MYSFSLYQPTRLFFGADQLTAFASACAPLGTRALLLMGGGSARRMGYADEVTKALAGAGIALVPFSGIEPNPDSATVNRAAGVARSEKASFVVALGGGSVMDAAKGIAVLLATGESDIWPFCWGEPKAGTFDAVAPVVCIPTTAATASEVTPFAIISNRAVKGKSGLGDDRLKPAASWLNPAYTTSVSPVTTADGGADILSHVFEHYLTGGEASPLADRHSEAVMATVLETLPRAVSHPGDVNLRADLLWASNLALNGYQSAGRGPGSFPMHSLEHALSGWQPDLAHGRGLATLFPSYFRWLHQHGRSHSRLAQLGRRLFGVTETDDSAAALAFIDRFTAWLRDNHLLQSLADLGFSDADFPAIAGYAVRVYGENDVIDAAGPLTADDAVAIFRATARA